MLIAQLSDTHITSDLPERERRLSDLARTVAALNALDPQPDVVIHTGDLANRAKPPEYVQAKAILSQLHAPFYPVPGNRDDRDLLRESFIDWPFLCDDGPFVQYAVDGHAVRLLGLDSHSGTSQKGQYCERRAAALGDALAARPETPTAIFMHHPPFEVADDPYSFQYETRESTERLLSTLGRAGNVIRIFCGHAHRARSIDLDGIRASTMPSIAVDLRMGEDPERPSTAPRFQLHRYTPQRRFDTTSVEAGD